MSRDAQIKKALEELKVASFTELLRKTKLSNGRLDRGLKSLIKSGEVLQPIKRGSYALKKYKKRLCNYIQNKKMESAIFKNHVERQSIKKALNELSWLFDNPNPPLRRIASHPEVRMSPQKVLEILYTLGWREPLKEEDRHFELIFRTRAESAWQLKHEPEKRNFHEDYKKKLKQFLILYPNETRNPHTRRV